MAARSLVSWSRNATHLTLLRFPGSCCVPNRRRGAGYSAPSHRSSVCKPAAASRPPVAATARKRGGVARALFGRISFLQSALTVVQAKPHFEHVLSEAGLLIGTDCRLIAAVDFQTKF